MEVKRARLESEMPLESSTGTPAEENAAGQAGSGEKIAQVEIGGRKGLDPTRYGDWEKNGRCIDF
jgi:hypothetical protein